MKKKIFQTLGFILVFFIVYMIFLILFKNFNYHYYCEADAYIDMLFSMNQVLYLVVVFFFSELLLRKGIGYSFGLQIIAIILIINIILEVYFPSSSLSKNFIKSYLFTIKGFLVTETPIIIAFLSANYIKNMIFVRMQKKQL